MLSRCGLGLLALLAAARDARSEHWYLPTDKEERPVTTVPVPTLGAFSAQVSHMSYVSDEIRDAAALAIRAHVAAGKSEPGQVSWSVAWIFGVLTLDEQRFGELGLEVNPWGGINLVQGSGVTLSILTPALGASVLLGEERKGGSFWGGITGLRFCSCGLGERAGFVIDVRAPVYGGFLLVEEDDDSASGMGWGGNVSAGLTW